MHATDFIAKRRPGSPAHDLNERAGAQAHFIDLCRLLDVPEPADPQRYSFERGVTQTGSSTARTNGFADAWLQGHFAWDYKAPGRSLEGALKQLMMYAQLLESPPLPVVSDRLRTEAVELDTDPWPARPDAAQTSTKRLNCRHIPAAGAMLECGLLAWHDLHFS